MKGKIAVIPAQGIGDSLIFHTVSFYLQKKGYEVVTFSKHLPSFGNWFKDSSFLPPFALHEVEKALSSFDFIFLQHDNSLKSKRIRDTHSHLFSFLGSYHPLKHGPFRSKWDYVCNQDLSMVDNVSLSLKKFYGSNFKENGLTPPIPLIHRKYKRRVVIHPTSSQDEKSWPKEKFLKVYDFLIKEGYQPVFAVSEEEKPLWKEAQSFSSLDLIAEFLYESGFFIGNDSALGHLASNLNIPHLIIGPSQKHLRFWRPGWYPGKYCFPPNWVDTWKWSQKNWKSFIPSNQVIKTFKNMVLKN